MFNFSSRSFLLAFLFAAATFIECGPLVKKSSSFLKNNDSTSMFNSSLDSAFLSNISREISRELLKDDSSKPAAINSGNNAKIVGEGKLKLQMSQRALDFIANLRACTKSTLICYKALPGGNDKARALCPPNYCGFQLWADDTYVNGIDFKAIQKRIPETSTIIHMEAPQTTILLSHEPSCDPAFEDDDTLLMEVVTYSDTCSIEVADAKVIPEPEPALPSSGNEASESSEAGLQWYVWLLISLAIVVVAGVIAGFVICWLCKIGCFKRRAAPPVKPSIIVAEPVISTVVKKAENGGSQMVKSKEVTKDETTTVATEEVVKPPPKPPLPAAAPLPIKPRPSKMQFKSAIKSLQKNDPVDQADRPGPSRPVMLAKPKTFSAKSLKSALSRRLRDSRDEQAIDVPIVLDTPYSCMKRKNMLSFADYTGAKIIFRPNAKREPTDKEVLLLANYVSDGFVLSNILIVDAQTLLKKNGVIFIDDHIVNNIVPNTPTAEYLQDVNTPDYVRFVCFGAKYGSQIGLDEKDIVEYSMPLLMVIVLTPSIQENSRRHALAVLKRNAPAILAGTLPKERKKYGYPSNALEAAYKRNRRCFKNIELVRTVSSPNLSEVAISGDKTTHESKEVILTQSQKTPVKKTTIDDEKEIPVKPLRRNTLK